MLRKTEVLELPFPNSLNTHWRHARGVTYISKQGLEYRKAVKVAMQEYAFDPFECRIEVGVELYPPNKRAFDIDNRIKALLDALQAAGAFIDDGLVDRLVVERKQIVKGGKCRVFISEIIESEN